MAQNLEGPLFNELLKKMKGLVTFEGFEPLAPRILAMHCNALGWQASLHLRLLAQNCF